MKYYIIAGEASGDLHASNLMKEIKLLDNEAHFRCWGGDLMLEQDAELVKHYSELAFMGFVEVLQNIRTIFNNIKFCKKDIKSYKPDALILVDYPGFNLRIANFAKNIGIKVFYYISPQVWAWKQSRVKKIKKCVDKMFVILPFEKEFYKKHDFKVDFVGHPLLDAIQSSHKSEQDNFVESNNLRKKPIIALLPGSRKQEIKKMLPTMLKIVPDFKDYNFVIAATSSIQKEFYDHLIKENNVKIIYNKTYDLLKNSVAALITSGTATLEAALFELPEVVCYKASYISYRLAKKFIKVEFISLANLIMKRKIITELIQNDFNENNLKSELNKILNDKKQLTTLNEDYKELKKKLGGAGASHNTAKLIVENLKN